MWTSAQRAIVLVIVVSLLLYLSLRFAFHRTSITDPQPLDGARSAELATRLDPNTATQAELAAIPNLGEKLAAAIIDYRNTFAATHPGAVAFVSLGDLLHVRGIGVAKIENLRNYLTIPVADRPATQP
jgi:DNA uptake protein ComE-like DNA-binding protein